MKNVVGRAACSALGTILRGRGGEESTRLWGDGYWKILAILLCLTVISSSLVSARDPLPSWREGQAKTSIVKFVNEVTNPESPDFVPREQRIAVFDNDGTLWTEHPTYAQLLFTIDRVKRLAPAHPGWKDRQPFKAVLENDMNALAATGKRGLVELMLTTHAGMTTEQFQRIVKDWIATARHPRFHRPYTALVYQPTLELLAYLRAKGFKTYIVSGGGIEFMRPWTEKVYGIPPEQVIGSCIGLKFEMKDGKPSLMRLSEVEFIDDKEGKPVGIQRFIGRRPIAAFGNSDGDLQMLQWTTANSGKTLGVIIHHTDAKREYAYDRKAPFGRLDKALDEANSRGWIVVDMKKDWARIFPFEN